MSREHNPSRLSESDLSDPALDAMLNEALSPDAVPGGVPAGLSGRIVYATSARLHRRTPAVVARIGMIRRIAAMLVLGATAAIIITTWPNATTTNPIPSWAEIEVQLNELASVQSGQGGVTESQSLDEALMELAMAIEHDPVEDAASWTDVAAAFEAQLDAGDTDPRDGDLKS